VQSRSLTPGQSTGESLGTANLHAFRAQDHRGDDRKTHDSHGSVLHSAPEQGQRHGFTSHIMYMCLLSALLLSINLMVCV
jgi:hypothetical protein